MSADRIGDSPVEAEPSWLSSQTSFMTMSDPSDSSTAISNNSFDETFASNKFSSNSFRNSSLLQSDELEDNSYGDVDRREQVEAETERVEDKQQQQQQPELKKKRTGVTLVYAPEKSATLFNASTQNSTVPIQSNDKVMIIHSKQDNGNHNDADDNDDDDIDSSNNNNYTENHSFTNKHDNESTMNSSSMQFNRTLSSSASNEENLSQSNHQHSHIVIEELTNSNNISHSNSSDQFSSDNYDNHSSELSNYEDPSEGIGDDDHNTTTSINNNVNLNHNKDNHYNNSDNVLSTSPAVLTSSPSSLDNHKDLSILSMMESESSSKDILTTTTTTTTSSISNNNDVNNNKNESYTNNTINFDENNNSTTMLQNQQELNTNTSSIIHPIHQHINNTSPVNLTTLSQSDNFIKSTISTDHDVDNEDGDDDDDDALFQSNLNNNRTQVNYESDDEVTKTFLNIHDQYKQTMNTFNEQPVPLYLDRCSPAQIVAVTGGAPFDIIRDIEEDFYDGNDDADVRDGDNVVEVLNTNVKRDGDSSASPVNSDHIVRKRGHTTSESSKPVSINIDLRVVSKLTPSTPEEVDASSELVFSNFMINRYMLEVSASAQVSSSQQSTASTSASIHLSGINPEIESDDPVSHQLSALPRAEPHSIEAIVARNLAEIGDEINRIYGSRLDRMIKLLPVEDCPLEMFYNVARVLFARGPTNWGQVITLFYFGYRLVVQRVKKGIANAFYQVCRCLIGFCRQINIFVWIAQQGGWQILQFLRSNNKTTTCDYENVDEKANHTITSNSTLYTNENDQQNTLLLNNNNNQSMDNLNNDSRLLIPLVLTSTGFVVIAVALWFYLRR